MKVAKFGQVYESYEVEAKVKKTDEVLPQSKERETHDDDVRLVIYQVLENALNSKNIDGKQCVLRAICETSQLIFEHESGLLGGIFHVLFVPSTTHVKRNKNDYILAEELGRNNDECENVFSQCNYSLLYVFSQIG
ncbi:CLUMA_CG011258, isoform A [Clunio marinus]|uniref:CLUMA_CG011258, isoform A n=1 Tax=Clunio marinus TaxID=568069 RepID=A0A1J1ICF9_9DIPT|nr:CLUMA_CG011258, isoform A [Clunio marinus]